MYLFYVFTLTYLIHSYHGEEDEMVPEALHRKGIQILHDAGCDATYSVEPELGHSLSMDEMQDLKKFLKHHIKEHY